MLKPTFKDRIYIELQKQFTISSIEIFIIAHSNLLVEKPVNKLYHESTNIN